ncbi:MAG: glucuronate isomerase [Oscillospiraceae bacterium]|jgi:glucuronate isomerase|nr:glucuronate isomerase [Oscillospiraceae bacterium]
MKPFMDEDFLLPNGAAKTLYHDYAKHMPIADYHCHIDPEEIARDRSFDNLAQLWLGGDHYKWRLMRANGVPEEYITGGAPDYDKFLKFAGIMPKAVGNPVYHWAHLELRRYFGCDLELNAQNAPAVWAAVSERLPGLTAKEIIRRSSVKVIATTDDPADSLVWHEAIRKDASFETSVVPAFRPDFALSPERDGYPAYLEELGQAAGMAITSFDKLCEALEKRAEYFDRLGCRASDHGMAAIPFRPAPAGEAEAAFRQARDGRAPGADALLPFKTALLVFLAGVYKRLGWAMQLHYGVRRGVNTRMHRAAGPDTGFDCIGPAGGGRDLARFLDLLAADDRLPKTVVYSLDPNDNAMIDSVLASFQDGGAGMQHGPAWWFNDSRDGIERHLRGLANFSLLGAFIGMLTDSRSFLSYTRHEYFRRILCGLLGGWAENGEIPFDREALGRLTEDISYHNAMRYFGF